MTTPLRVGTYNIHHGAPPGGPVDHGALVASVAALRADVIALQEVDRCFVRSRFADQTRLVGDALGMHGTFLRSRFLWGGSVGNALISPVAPRILERIALPRRAGHDQRMAVVAGIETRIGTLNVIVTHLHPAAGEPHRQLEFLLARVASLAEPAVLLGDLNAGPDALGDLVTGAGWTAVGHGPTFPASSPREQIDWIAVRGLSAVAVETPQRLSSDHLPVVAELTPTPSPA